MQCADKDVGMRRGDLLQVRVQPIRNRSCFLKSFSAFFREVFLILELVEQDLHPVDDGMSGPALRVSQRIRAAKRDTDKASNEERDDEPDMLAT